MQRLKVAYILHRFPYLTETFIMREIYWLRKQGVEVNIYSLLSPQDEPVHDQAQELLEVTHYSPFLSWGVLQSQFGFLFRSPIKYFKSLSNVVRQTIREPAVMLRSLLLFPKSVHFASQIRAQNVDHIHSHFVWIDGIAAGVVSDLIGVTFTIHPHAFGLFSRNQQAVKAELEHATEVITISNFHKKYIKDLCPKIELDRIHVVYCALETDMLSPLQKTPADGGPLQILSVGRLIEKKGFEYLVAACKILRDKKVDFQCRIIGSGSLQAKLEKQIHSLGLADHVHLLGSKSQTEVLQFYREADMFVLPCVVAGDGDRDGIPVVLMEAMAYEIPVVTTPVTGIPDLVENDHNGLLVGEHDVEGLAVAIERLGSDSALRRRLGGNARQTVQDKFDIRKNTAQLAEIFKQVSETSFAETIVDSSPFELQRIH